MKLPRERLRVFPNPFCVELSAEHPRSPGSGGRAVGTCPSDPADAPGELVGVVIDAEFLTPLEKNPTRVRKQRTSYSYLGVSNEETEPFQLVTELAGKEPVDLANTEYYRERIAEGALIAADLETARLCGVSDGEFEEPADMLERLAKARVEHFNVETFENDKIEGRDAYAHFCAKRKAVADAKAPSEVAATTSPSTPSAKVVQGRTESMSGRPGPADQLPSRGVQLPPVTRAPDES